MTTIARARAPQPSELELIGVSTSHRLLRPKKYSQDRERPRDFGRWHTLAQRALAKDAWRGAPSRTRRRRAHPKWPSTPFATPYDWERGARGEQSLLLHRRR